MTGALSQMLKDSRRSRSRTPAPLEITSHVRVPTPQRPTRRRQDSLPERAKRTAVTGGATSAPSKGHEHTTLSRVQRAAAALRPAGLAGRLPCRDTEQDKILAHVRGALRNGGSEQVLYVPGMPGTGKTAAVLHVVQQLQESGEPPFIFVHVNAMRLGAPTAIFNDIRNQLPIERRRAASAAQGEVEVFFSGRQSKDPVVFLLIDEVDQLVTKSQSVLYALFDMLSWKARLVIAAISNTMDLPERLLPRVASRFEIVRVDFWPYIRDQIHMILLERLRHHNASELFSSDALRLCAARVAAGTGDVRKALQLCRRAMEICQSDVSASPEAVREQDGVVTTAHMNSAAQGLLYTNTAATAIAGLSSRTRRILVAVLLELRDRSSDVVPLRAVASRYQRLLSIMCDQVPPSSASHAEDVAFIVERLTATSILISQPQLKHARQQDKCRSGADGLCGGDDGVVLSLGGLDVEDLAAALLKVELDARVRSVIQN